MRNGSFSPEQVEILLRPLKPERVENRTQGGQRLSYLSQHDVRAHAIRLFGFGNVDIETLEIGLAFEDQVTSKSGSGQNWSVGYRSTVQVTIRNEHGEQVCRFSETAVGTSQQPSRAEAHDMAVKTATSDAMKRCFINLGDQFGLSLYNNGSTRPFVGMTVVRPSAEATTVAASIDEAPVAEPERSDSEHAEPHPDTLAFLEALGDLCDETEAGKRIVGVASLKAAMPDVLGDLSPFHGVTLGVLADRVAASGTMGGAA